MGVTQNEKAMLFCSLQRVWAEAHPTDSELRMCWDLRGNFTWKNVMRADNARIKFRLRQATIAKQYSLAVRTKSARPNEVFERASGEP
jgi:hypothetical protein